MLSQTAVCSKYRGKNGLLPLSLFIIYYRIRVYDIPYVCTYIWYARTETYPMSGFD